MQSTKPSFSSCAWCGARNSWGTLVCHRCGGPQPAVEVGNIGPEPPPVPRNIPRRYQFQVFMTHVTGLVGAIMMSIGLPLLILFPIVGLSRRIWALLLIGGGLGGFFVGIGAIMFVMGLVRVRRHVNIYRKGQIAVGTVTALTLNRNKSAVNRYPWKIEYEYQAKGVPYTGYANAWHPLVEEGSPLHVLYLSADLDESVLYPPMSSRKP